ncbi:MAG: sensor domain-containing diguanylate cyclase, partial [Bacilli bacterium]
DLASEIKAKNHLLVSHKELSQLYKRESDYYNAYSHLEKYEEIKTAFSTQHSNMQWNKVQKKQFKHEVQIYKNMYDQMTVISRIGQAITSNLKMEDVLRVVYNEAKSLLKMDVFGIAAFNNETDMLCYDLFMEKGERIIGGEISVHLPDSFGAYVVRTKNELLINNIDEEYDQYITKIRQYETGVEEVVHSILCVPLIMSDDVKGFIMLQSYKKNAYVEDDLMTLRALSSYVVIALENARLFQQIEKMAKHDALTGAYNRAEIVAIAERECEKADIHPLFLAIFDIDNFKLVNDTYGHVTGDKVLQYLTEVVDRCCPRGSWGRYGGEEFLLILPECNKEIGMFIIENIRKEYLKINEDKKLNVEGISVSAGAVLITSPSKPLYESVTQADKALYQAKRTGKNQCIFSEEQ